MKSSYGEVVEVDAIILMGGGDTARGSSQDTDQYTIVSFNTLNFISAYLVVLGVEGSCWLE